MILGACACWIIWRGEMVENVMCEFGGMLTRVSERLCENGGSGDCGGFSAIHQCVFFKFLTFRESVSDKRSVLGAGIVLRNGISTCWIIKRYSSRIVLFELSA